MPPPGQNPTAVWDGRSLLAGLEVSLKSWAGLPVTVAVVVVVGGLWCGQIACSAKAHALQPTRATFAFDDLPLLVGGGAGVHGHEEEGPALPGPRPLPLLCLVVVVRAIGGASEPVRSPSQIQAISHAMCQSTVMDPSGGIGRVLERSSCCMIAFLSSAGRREVQPQGSALTGRIPLRTALGTNSCSHRSSSMVATRGPRCRGAIALHVGSQASGRL